MCGIVAYVGTKSCAPILVEGLRRLEYRGYDSAGLALQTGHGVEIVRAVGKLANLDAALKKTPLTGTTGIGHTRWATHGRPSEANAHPHVAGKVAVVHNGIIENHVQLRRELEGRGVTFHSDTDTEIIAHLVDESMRAGSTTLEESVRAALKQVRGAYAIAVVSGDVPDQIVVAKYDSPLVLGVGDGESFAASDIPAMLAHTRDVILLQDGEMAVLTKGAMKITMLDGTPVTRASKRIDWSPTQAEKGGYKHFMLKEIHEQPRAIEDTLRGRIDIVNADVIAAEIGLTEELAKKVGRVYFVACGTSAHAAMAARYWVEALARIPSVVEIGSEVRYRNPVFLPNDLVVAVSQSGETLDTLAAVKTAKAAGAQVIAVANVVDSAIARIADGALYTHAGPEIGVASTKCFTTQLAALLMLAVYLGRRRGTLPEAEARRVLDALWRVPAQMREVLASSDDLKVIAKKHLRARDMLFLGRGTQFPIALEGALKLKEISYIHAEGYAAGETGQLARLKPDTRYLTAYYLMMSAGGALGGIAVSLIAPHVFHDIVEWKVSIFIAALAASGIILSAVVTRAVPPSTSDTPRDGDPTFLPRVLLFALLIPFALMFLDLTQYLFSSRKGIVYQSRNFFGALTIKETPTENHTSDELVLLNGTTIHGTQFVTGDRRGMPTSYYATNSGIGRVLNYFHANRPPGGVRIGDVGLGAGTLAAYALKLDNIRFYEINPTVIDISTSGKWFTYISDCKQRGAHCDIKLGDARLSLQNEGGDPKELPYHVLVLDAFSGDAVPTHLLTAEAMDIYLPRIASEANMGVDGALLIHVSNRYLDLDRVARGAAEHIGFEALQIRSPGNDAQSINSADWVVLTKNKDLIEKLRPVSAKPSADDKPPVLWTDAHSSLFEILR